MRCHVQTDVRVKGKSKVNFQIQGMLGQEIKSSEPCIREVTWCEYCNFGRMSRCTKSFKAQLVRRERSSEGLFPYGERNSVWSKHGLDILCKPFPLAEALGES